MSNREKNCAQQYHDEVRELTRERIREWKAKSIPEGECMKAIYNPHADTTFHMKISKRRALCKCFSDATIWPV
jgi:hypothetical protein